ncbi:MAG: hypothetical protein GY796_16580 [Chloroflexi bacterium]|nr:hypothetical protein [Chloroflexota bacterium]
MIGWLPGETNAVDVRDVAAAHIAAAERGRVGERYILGGHNLPVRAALTTAARVAGVKPPWFEIPLWGAEGLAKLGTLLPALPLPANHLRTVRHWQRVNAQKAQQELGLAPRPFEDTVRDALDWFRAEGML